MATTHLFDSTDKSATAECCRQAPLSPSVQSCDAQNSKSTRPPITPAVSDVNQDCLSEFEETMDLDALSWRGISITATDRSTGKARLLVENVNGIVKAGERCPLQGLAFLSSILIHCRGGSGESCAFIGPSGSGKTTLLNALAKRPPGPNKVDGTILINGKSPSYSTLKEIASFVQNDEPFISALTVSETLHFASRLAGPR